MNKKYLKRSMVYDTFEEIQCSFDDKKGAKIMAKRKDSKGRVLKKGESIRRDGLYMYRYTDLDGTRKSIYEADLNILREKEKLIQRDLDDGIGYQCSNLPFNEYFETYLSLKGNLAAGTRRTYETSWRIYIQNNKFGKLNIKNIKKSDVLVLLKSMSDKGLSKSSIGTIVAGVLSPCFKMAIEDNIIRSNPCVNCRKSIAGEDSEPENVLTVEQQTNFLSYIKNSKYAIYHPMFCFMLETAVRVGEVCGLTWNDIDLKNGFVHITHQLQYTKGKDDKCGYQITDPKSKAGIRNIPLSTAARKALAEQKKLQFEMGKRTNIKIDGYEDFVFSNRDKKPFISSGVGRLLKRIVEDYNRDIKKFKKDSEELPHIHPHLLRHTACSRMAEAGIDPRTLQTILGHSSIRMTMEVYNHVTDERLSNEIKKLDQMQNGVKVV